VPTLLVLCYLATIALRVVLSVLNIRYRRRHASEVPSEFADTIDRTTLEKISMYNADRERFGLVQLFCSTLVVLLFLFAGGLAAYDHFTTRLASGTVGQGVMFFVGLQIGSSVLELPFDAFSTFRIEQRHGFNRTSTRLFLSDWLKSTLLAGLFAAGVSAAGILLLEAAPRWYWLWFWAFGVGLGVVLMLISPYVIEPLFIKTVPLADGGLAAAVRDLAERAGVRVTQVLQVDASRRTAHSNAYFTGIGRVKRVVVFDTLLERLTHSELLAVLAHEIGHSRLRHIPKRLISSALLGLLGLYVAAQLLADQRFPSLVGLSNPSVPAEVVMLAFMASLLGFLLTPLFAAWSREHERQADGYAAELTRQPADLAAALRKLAQDNLSSLHTHPLYAGFYHSHPPAALRVRRLLSTPHPVPDKADRS
jgi:STE24 endopeptidase